MHVQGASFGDVNSDGEMEVVFATNTGAVYMVSGATGTLASSASPGMHATQLSPRVHAGRDIAGFPFRTRGRVMAPVLLTQALPGSDGLQAVMPSSDGHLYVIDALTGRLLSYTVCFVPCAELKGQL